MGVLFGTNAALMPFSRMAENRHLQGLHRSLHSDVGESF